MSETANIIQESLSSTLVYPNKKHEEYKYCDIQKYLTPEYSLEQHKGFNKAEVEKLVDGVKSNLTPNSLLLVHVNGKFIKEYSIIKPVEGLTIQFSNPTNDNFLFQNYFDKCVDKEEILVKNNAQHIQEILFVNSAKAAEIAEPIVILYINDGSNKTVYSTRRLFVAEKRSKMHFVDVFVSTPHSSKFHNCVTEICIEKNAKVNHVNVQNVSNDDVLLTTTQALQQEYCKYKNFSICVNGQLIRNNTHAALDGEYIETFLYGLYMSDKKSVVDNHTLVDHRKPNCYSNELYKGILAGKSIGVFNGKIFVRQDAQKTNAYQSNRNILISKDATINTKPQLEIFADDVKCSHGTSTGKIDEEALFYLQSRGIGKDKAKQLMLHAFIAEVSDALPEWALNNYISTILEQKLVEHEG